MAMLIEFRVTNFRSFRDEQRFSMVAATADKSLRDNTLTSAGFKYRLLRSAVAYGPNASGKSNLILALGFLHLLILQAVQSPPTPGRRLIDHPLLKPFLLEAESSTAPTTFELSFLHESVRYQYGLVLDRAAIHEEWLIAYPKGQPQTWFTRHLRDQAAVDPRLRASPHRAIREQPSLFGSAESEAVDPGDHDLYTWYFGSRLSGEKQRLANLTRADVPFLSAGATFGNQQLRHVFDWFARRLVVLNPWGLLDLVGETAKRTIDDTELRTMVRDLLAHADFGIEDFRVQEIPVKDEPQLGSTPEQLRTAIDGLDFRRVDIHMRHAAPNLPEGSIELDRDDESLGTVRFFGIAGPIADALRHGKTLLVDELDDSLHPLLVRHLIRLFHSPQTNPHNAQLVFNTHDVTMLDTELFRRDQIWLTEKGNDGASTLVPLSDYSPRKDESLMRGYLYGRYGAVPLLEHDTVLHLPKRKQQPAADLVSEGTRDA